MITVFLVWFGWRTKKIIFILESSVESHENFHSLKIHLWIRFSCSLYICCDQCKKNWKTNCLSIIDYSVVRKMFPFFSSSWIYCVCMIELYQSSSWFLCLLFSMRSQKQTLSSTSCITITIILPLLLVVEYFMLFVWVFLLLLLSRLKIFPIRFDW